MTTPNLLAEPIAEITVTGTVEVCGLDPRRAVREGRVSAVMQTGGLLMDFTVAETIRAIALLHHRVDRVSEVIDRAARQTSDKARKVAVNLRN